MKNNDSGTPNFGFVSADGFFHKINSLNTSDLEYVSMSLNQLQEMLAENLQLERYEKCAEIRDYLEKRINKK
jgi:protein-arginine kinase activator protein McsA